MLETNGADVDVERIMYEIRDAVARQPGGAATNGTAVLFSAARAEENGDGLRLQPAFQPNVDKHYHVNDLLRFHGAEFLRNSYLAVLGREPDEIGLAKHLDGLASGRFNKLDVLASLHSSSEGRNYNAQLDGLSLPIAVRRLGRVPVLGYLVRLLTAAGRLPQLVQHQNQFEFYLWSQLQRAVDYQNQARQENKDALAQISAQILEGLQRTAEQQQTIEAALRLYETLAVHHAELSKIIEDRFVRHEQRMDHEQQILNQRHEATKQDLLNAQQQLRERIDGGVKQLIERQQTLRRELKGQDRRVTALLEGVSEMDRDSPFTRVAAEEDEHLFDELYAAFEDRFRGEQSEVQQRLEVYLPVLTEANIANGVLDLGCGRGEWLRLLRSKGIEAQGVDRNRLFVEDCRSAGLEVFEADVLAHLRGLPSDSLNVVTSFHLVEHLPFAVLIKLLDEIERTLKPGGLIILETPNPENFMVGSCTFYTDPTHRNPIPSQTLEFLLEARGFADVKIWKLRPWEDAKLEGDTELVQRFNEFFYSAPDYGIIAQKP